MQEINWVQ